MQKITTKNLNDLGLYMRIIYMDYKPKNNTEMCELIEQHFGIQYEESDIENYERLFYEQEDYEKLSRMIENGNIEHIVE